MKNKLIGSVILLAVGFLGGWYPEHAKRVQAEDDAAAARKQVQATGESLALYTFRNRAALLQRQAESNDYATAGQEATRFFTDLRAHTSSLPPGGMRDGLEQVMNRRDTIIAGLAKADPAVKAELGSVFMDLQKI